jgi:hypothetical protein
MSKQNQVHLIDHQPAKAVGGYAYPEEDPNFEGKYTFF